MLTQSTIRRLAFARYLLELGVKQSHAAEPASAVAVLMFHDAAELLLQLACEHKNVGASDLAFMDYFTRLDPKVPPSGLAHREAMRRLNNARKGLKHSGTLPSNLDIESFRGVTQLFFIENVALVFGVSLETLSLVDLVASDDAREMLREAEARAQQGDSNGTIERIAVAFHHLLSHHRVSIRARAHRVPSGWDRSGAAKDPAFITFLEDLAESVTRLQADVGLLRHGIDPRRLARFQGLTPHVAFTLDGTEHIVRTRLEDATREEADFCMDFVVQTALLLQQDELTLNPREP